MRRVEEKVLGARWHIVTSEYPPQTGGVSDYTRLVAEGLAAAGDEVHVWCPSLKADELWAGEVEDENGADEVRTSRGVEVHREFGGFAPADLRRVGRLLDRHAGPRRLLVQYVPHGYGYRSLNVAFCLWLWKRARLCGDRVELMVHEPFCAFGEGSLKQDAAAAIHRLMTTILLRAARRVWTSIPAWAELWRPYALGRRVEFEWLPVPCTVPVSADAGRAASLRTRFATAAGARLVGHFGTYPRHVAERLKCFLPALLSRDPTVSALLIGRGGEALRDELASLHPALAARLHATGVLAARELSSHLAACDLLVQPFPDGVSSRRTSVMAALAHGLAVVTTRGRLTEPLWAESGAVKLVSAGNTGTLLAAVENLLADDAARAALGRAARDFYRERFDAARVVAELRRGGEADEASAEGVPARAGV